MTVSPFTWRDGERTIVFGRGCIDGALEHLGSGYTLLTTPRAAALVPQRILDAADERHDVPSGFVDELAGDLLEKVGHTDSDLIVALGGGRIVDTAKALGSALGRPVAAIPTTLSAAEMTWVHRRARGAAQDSPPTRARVVVNDPAICASQPPDELAASSANALAHAVEAPLTTMTSPVPTLCAHESARLIATAWADESAPDRDALALASLLSGNAIDASWYGLSHVCSQTLVRVGGAGHGPANACVLPWTTAALRTRAPEAMAALDAAAGIRIEDLAVRLAALAGATRARDIGVTEDKLDACAEAAASRPELDLTPPRATREEIREKIYAAAW